MLSSNQLTARSLLSSIFYSVTSNEMVIHFISDILAVVKEIRSLRSSHKKANLENRIRMAEYFESVSDVYSKLLATLEQSQKKGDFFPGKRVFASHEYLLAQSLMQRFEIVTAPVIGGENGHRLAKQVKSAFPFSSAANMEKKSEKIDTAEVTQSRLDMSDNLRRIIAELSALAIELRA